MKEFKYILEKIKKAEFCESPFRHILIENFLSEEDFQTILSDEQVHFEKCANTGVLLKTLREKKYLVQNFPGCTSNEFEYLRHFKNNSFPKNRKGNPVSSYGITYRLSEIHNAKIKRLIDFLNSSEFENVLRDKFLLKQETIITTAIQKNLSHYEISPHPDISSKALTYLLNINKEGVENLPVHTHLLKFKKDWEWIKNFWKKNQNLERTWVPWDWCTTVKTTNLNNSIVIFSPNCDTLHAAKMIYDHNSFQRTQIYGNLMYDKPSYRQKLDWTELKGRKNDIAL